MSTPSITANSQADTTTANTQVDDLNKLIPTINTKQFGGKDILIAPFKIGKLPQVLAAIQPLTHMLMNRQPGQKTDVSSIFMLYADDCLTLLAVLANQPRDWVDTLEQDEAFALFSLLLEANIDFFIQRVLPSLMGAMERLTQLAKNNTAMQQVIGQIASKTSSPTVIATTTS